MADLVVGGDMVARPKPAADGMELVARELGVPTGQLVLVGDSELDLRAAEAAGSMSAAAAWGHMYSAEAAADVTLEAPGDVLGLLEGPVVR